MEQGSERRHFDDKDSLARSQQVVRSRFRTLHLQGQRGRDDSCQRMQVAHEGHERADFLEPVRIQVLTRQRITFRELYRTETHKYTVLDLCFSPCSNMLASVSKNRQLSLYFRWSFLEENASLFASIDIKEKVAEFLEHNKEAINPDNLRGKECYYIPIHTQEIHSKLIFSVSVSQSCRYVVTGSRDKKIQVFRVLGEDGFKFELVWSKKMKNSVRAVEFLEGQQKWLAIGLDSGEVLLADIEGIRVLMLRKPVMPQAGDRSWTGCHQVALQKNRR